MDLHTTLTALCAVEQGPLDGQLLRVTGLVPEVPSSQALGAQCLLRRGLGQTAGTSGEAGEEGGAFGSESRAHRTQKQRGERVQRECHRATGILWPN